MAHSSADLATYETTRLALDKPLVATQAIPISPAYAKWVDDAQVSSGSIATWSDRSTTTGPARYAYDGYPGFISTVSGTTCAVRSVLRPRTIGWRTMVWLPC